MQKRYLGLMAGGVMLAVVAGWLLADGAAPVDERVAASPVVDRGSASLAAAPSVSSAMPANDAAPQPDAMLTPSLVLIFESVLAEAQATGKAAFMAVAPGLLAKHLPADLRSRAMGLLERYVDMQEAMQALPPPDTGDPAALRRTIEARAEVRRRYFAPEEIQGLFDDEIRQDSFMVEKMEINRNAGLSPEQRDAALRGSEEAWLTPEQRELRRSSTAHVDVQKQTEALNARGASPQERFAERNAAYGYEAARGLASLDQENHDWNSRLDQYANAPQGQQAQLRETLFNEQERLRLSGALALRVRPLSAQASAAGSRAIPHSAP